MIGCCECSHSAELGRSVDNASTVEECEWLSQGAWSLSARLRGIRVGRADSRGGFATGFYSKAR